MTRDVRQATVDDVWAVHETARESWHAAYDEILGPETVDDIVDDWYAIGDIESSITDAIGREDVAFLVAEPATTTEPGELERECCGFAHVVPWPENPAVGYLARLYVSPPAWREGTGTALLEALTARLDDSFDRVRLAVLTDNDIGISFAESTGFEHVETRATGLADGLEEYVYEKPI
ncbi:GNAT family N-acetyltransferase [Natronorubrum sp. JWXQ-INN-674]|uniref:GNAT family N-acetyltransferase n=1 Tax=Natronorubrum halalkaliphilum TaxID=2691917 RepID=A0A6B0VRD1_9EURY|nr:GNAT family N-acetyltransferase [Natronorubrum halalkaliphilum]MXV63059.1 GNAT family N-acetyltransferase [Natronorubrum halalkaliphilum]